MFNVRGRRSSMF